MARTARRKRIENVNTKPQIEKPRRGRRRRQEPDRPAETPRTEANGTPAVETPETDERAAGRDSALVSAEAELMQRYPDRKIVRGSLRAAGAVQGFGIKRTLIIKCDQCGAERRVATSDVFHVRFCPNCKKQAKKAQNAAKAHKEGTNE